MSTTNIGVVTERIVPMKNSCRYIYSILNVCSPYLTYQSYFGLRKEASHASNMLSSFDRAFTLLFQSAVAAGAYLGGDRSIRNSLCRKEEEEKKEEKSRE